MAADSPVESLSAPASAGEETGLLLQDRIAGETAENEVLLDRMLLGDLLKMLNGRQREIIVRHYFYDQTQTQIAAQLGISQVQVSRHRAENIRADARKAGRNMRKKDRLIIQNI